MATVGRMVAWLRSRRGVVLLLLVGWAVIVSLGAGATPGSSRWLGVPPLEKVLLAFMALSTIVTVTVIVLALLFGERGEAKPVARKRSIWPTLVLLAIFVLLALRGTNLDESQAEPARPDTQEEDAPGGPRRAVISSGELIVLAAVAASAVALTVWSRRRIRSMLPLSDGDEADLETELEPVLKRATERLELGTDPRSAVIGAYADLEDGLTRIGHPRRSNETPTEHVRRVLANLPINADPVTGLAALYELARFSDHPITADDRRSATVALGRARNDLATLAGTR